MRFEADENTVLKMAVLAVNASRPMGLGFLHFESKDYTIEDVRPALTKAALCIDYFRGRMVKLRIARLGPTSWETPDNIAPDYQSWMPQYYTVEVLLNAAKKEAK